MEKSEGDDVTYRARSEALGEFLLGVDPDLVLPECPEGASQAAQRRVLRGRQLMCDNLIDITEAL